MSNRIVDVIKMEPTKKIEVSGWIRSFRANKFISLNDGSCMTSLQVVIDPDNFDTKTINGLNTGASIWVSGSLVESLGGGQKTEI